MIDFPQVRILHISDIHFGTDHICKKKSGARSGVPNLGELITKDLSSDEWNEFIWANQHQQSERTRLLLVVSGDLAHTANSVEFDSAFEFIKRLISKPILGTEVALRDVFVVPGNHDVVFTQEVPEHRFLPYCNFYNKLFRPISDSRAVVHPDQADKLTQVHAFPDDRLLVAEINSSYYVEKETLDESRGQVDLEVIHALRQDFERLALESKDWLKIAVVHHHPVLLPSFIEDGRSIDSILNAGSLLDLLRDHGFQLVLHGHKHFPQVFSYDPDPAWTAPNTPTPRPQLIVAGGAAGSKTLPEAGLRSNTYNLLTIKWNPKALQSRVQIVTRGLNRWSTAGELNPDQWTWRTLRVYDRAMSPYENLPLPRQFGRIVPPDERDERDGERKKVYERLRLNMPVVEVLPSLLPGQGYEARAWIVLHRGHRESPKQVLWSAGPKFDRKLSDASAAPDFCVSFHYWGPMLIQAELTFEDGAVETACLYARLPDAITRR
ncbi:MAG TPA: metallophosphoesterase [Bradyrhizobium sp.]|nr:metallophosphoesterase [Bradyrhizobium sp.]